MIDCDICNKSFKTLYYLYKHKRQIHKLDSQSLKRATMIDCDICNKSFKTLYYVNRHKRQVHKVESEPLKRGRPAISFTKIFACPVCNWNTTRKNYLRIHCIKRHPDKYRKKQVQLKCPVDGCTETFNSRRLDLAKHILNNHSSNFDKQYIMSEMVFSNMSEFKVWKLNEEQVTMTQYILIGKSRRNSEKITYTYVCHRSGPAKMKGKGIRPSKGSCKIGKICPAVMSVSYNKITEITNVVYFKVHIGHGQDIRHSTLTKKEQRKIANQLSKNIPLDVILKNIRESKEAKQIQNITQKVQEINDMIDQIKGKLLNEKINTNISYVDYIHSSLIKILDVTKNDSVNEQKISTRMENVPVNTKLKHETIFHSNKIEYIFV